MSAPQASEDIDDDVNDILGTTVEAGANGGKETTAVVSSRSRRRREEAVRRLVGDIYRRPDARGNTESHEWLVASTVATALERGLDKDLHSELVHEAKENAARIGQVCHDHSDAFLASVGKVVALGGPSGELSEALDQAHDSLQETSGSMLHAASYLEYSKQANQRARTLSGMVMACRNVAVLLERARKQASLGRPRAALDAVDEARNCLTAPVSSLLLGTTPNFSKPPGMAQNQDDANNPAGTGAVETLAETPFGKRAMAMLPKIEHEVMLGARRGLNRWFIALRDGGDGAKSGRAVLRKCSHSMAVGPGRLGLGGHLPPSYMWRAKVADNLLARLDQTGKVARAVRLGYWFDRDATKEVQRLESASLAGMERRAEAFAAAFGWYRCWDENAPLLVDVTELNIEGKDSNSGLSGSRHGSRHGREKGNINFRGSQGPRSSNQRRGLSLKTGPGARSTAKTSSGRSQWSVLLTPSILFENSSTRTEDDAKLTGLPESVHPVRRAELAFNLLGRADEFVKYYEEKRFGNTKLGGAGKGDGKSGTAGDGKSDTGSSLSSLTGDDVSVGTDRVFFAKSLPHLCSSVVGFSAVEAALELGFFSDEDDEDQQNGSKDKSGIAKTGAPTNSVSRFRDSSARYERALVTELGDLLRSRAIGASLAELCRASCLMAAFRSALKVVHPSSSTRRYDKENLAMDIDIVMTALKVAQDEMLKVTKKINAEDRKEPMVVTTMDHMQSKSKKKDTVPDEELVGIPFGLSVMKQKNTISGDAETPGGFEDHSRLRNTRQTRKEEYYTFSKSVPDVVRAIHARAIACAAFALSQEELGQVFSQKKGSGAAGYVLDCVEECISVAAVGLQDGDAVLAEGSVNKAVQTMANVAALQHSLPRLFGTLMRGMCHVGLIRNDQLSDTFVYAETTLKGADKACFKQVGHMYNLVYEICRSKIDSHINLSLDNFQWVSKAARDMPNSYCEGLIQYLRMMFAHLGAMDDGSRAGLHFSCCGHVAERLVKLLTDPPDSDHHNGNSQEETLPPITKIDAYGLKNLNLDVAEFERFADETGVLELSECFKELRNITTAMIDKDLPQLLRPENANERRRRYPLVSMGKLGNILEKYVGTGLVSLDQGWIGKNPLSSFAFMPSLSFVLFVVVLFVSVALLDVHDQLWILTTLLLSTQTHIHTHTHTHMYRETSSSGPRQSTRTS